MRVCLFEDWSSSLEPLSWTRPVFDLLCGVTSLGSKQVRHFSPCQTGVLLRPYLAELYRQQHPGLPVNDLAWLRAGPTVLVNGRWLPPTEPVMDLGSPCIALVDEEVAYAVVGPDQLYYCSLNTLAECVETWKKVLPRRPAGGRMIAYPWDLVEQNARQLANDFATLGHHSPTPAGVAIVGPSDQLLLDPTAHLDPLVVIDTRHGPVMIDHDAVINAFTRLEGPCYIGPNTQIFGAQIRGGVTLGPQCRIGGEVETSIVHGHSNKYHDGFLGHSYVGEWVNLGGGTSTSDLRNDYGPIVVTIDGQPTATGLTKVGCFLGDHTKTGLGTLINAGTNVGIFGNVLPAGRFAPKYVPSFTSWWNGALRENAAIEELLVTARRVMQRRGRVLTDAHINVYRHVCAETLSERRRVFRAADAQLKLVG